VIVGDEKSEKGHGGRHRQHPLDLAQPGDQPGIQYFRIQVIEGGRHEAIPQFEDGGRAVVEPRSGEVPGCPSAGEKDGSGPRQEAGGGQSDVTPSGGLALVQRRPQEKGQNGRAIENGEREVRGNR
jgi:hypothetical protein